jgi:hypothetical protein
MAENKRYAIVMGSNYAEPGRSDIKYAETDAEKINSRLKDYEYDTSLINKSDLFSVNVVEELTERVKAGYKQIILYYAGHAKYTGDDLKLHFNEEKHLLLGSIINELKGLLNQREFQVLIILDCCDANNAFECIKTDFSKYSNIRILVATGDSNKAFECPKLKSGRFTHELNNLFENPIDCTDDNGNIYLSTVFNSIRKRCKDKNNGVKLFDISNDEFLIAKSRPIYDINMINDRYNNLQRNLSKYIVNSPYPYSVKTKYSDIKSIDTLQEEIVKTIREELNFTEIKDYPESKKHYFDAVQRSEFAYTNKAFYAFPFFLTPIRLSTWGVIPYAKHRALGLMYNSNISDYKDLYNNKLAPHIHDKEGVSNNIYDKKLYGHWIIDLFEQVAKCNNNAKVCTVSGYMFNEIIPLMINRSGDTRYQLKVPDLSNIIHLNEDSIREYRSKSLKNKLNEMNNIVNSIEEKSNVLEAKIEQLKTKIDELGEYANYNEEAVVEKMIWDEVKTNANNIAIIDLASATSIYNIARKDKQAAYTPEIVALNHYLEIPVGIGFSLLAFEEIKEKQTLWDTLREVALKTLDVGEMNNIGIQLDLE